MTCRKHALCAYMGKSIGAGLLLFSSPLLLKLFFCLAQTTNENIQGKLDTNLPAQFITKLYTEALGTGPDQSEWRKYMEYFSKNGHTQRSLLAVAKKVFTCKEYCDLGYDNEQKVLTIFRALLCRDPERVELEYYCGRIASSGIETAISDCIFGKEFTSVIYTKIFSQKPYYWTSASAPAHLAVDTNSYGPKIFNPKRWSSLNAWLKTAHPGDTFCIRQKELVSVDTTVVIPEDITLQTVGAHITRSCQYACFSRIVRSRNFTADAELIRLSHGARIRNVWIDGQRAFLKNSDVTVGGGRQNLRVYGGNSAVINCRFNGCAGGSNIEIMHVPGKVNVENNLITCYETHHQNSVYLPEKYPWCDGISIHGNEGVIKNNTIIDATDVGIVMFCYYPEPGKQMSRISHNTVICSGNSAYAAIAIDPWYCHWCKQKSPPVFLYQNFDSAIVDSNVIWTSSYAHFDIGISVGARAWWGDEANYVEGVKVMDNTTGIRFAVCNIGICISNAQDVQVIGNAMKFDLKDVHNSLGIKACAVGVDIRNVSPKSVNLQTYTPVSVERGMSHLPLLSQD